MTTYAYRFFTEDSTDSTEAMCELEQAQYYRSKGPEAFATRAVQAAMDILDADKVKCTGGRVLSSEEEEQYIADRFII